MTGLAANEFWPSLLQLYIHQSKRDTARRLAGVGKLVAAQNKFDEQVLESLKRLEFSKQLRKRIKQTREMLGA